MGGGVEFAPHRLRQCLRRLVADLDRHLQHRPVARREQLAGALQAPPRDVGLHGRPEVGTKDAVEMVARHRGTLGQHVRAEIAVEVGIDVGRRAREQLQVAHGALNGVSGR